MTTAANILDLLKRVDGKGSGLDTDLVRGRKPGVYGLFLLEAETADDVDDGTGMLPGGLAGQVLTKTTSADYDLQWTTLKSVATSAKYWDLENIPADFVPRAHQHAWSDLISVPDNVSSLASLATTGLLARLTTGQVTARTLTAPAAGITITNPAGDAGNPTLVLANDLAALEGLATTGYAKRTATDTWATSATIPATDLTGTILDARLSSNVALYNVAGTFTAAQVLDNGTGALPALVQSAVNLRLVAAAGQLSGIEGNAWGIQALRLQAVAAGGSRSVPAASPAIDGFVLSLAGHDGTNYTTGAQGQYTMAFDGTWSGTNRGILHRWIGTPNGSTNAAEWMRLQGAVLTVNQSGFTAPVTAAGITLVGPAASNTTWQGESYGGATLFLGYRSNGTPGGTLTGVVAGDALTLLGGAGRTSSGAYTGSTALISLIGTETYVSGTNQGSAVTIAVTATGTGGRAEAVRVDGPTATQTVMRLQNANGSGSAILSLDPGTNGFNVRDVQLRAVNNGLNQIRLEFYTSNAATPALVGTWDHFGNLGYGVSPSFGNGRVQFPSTGTTKADGLGWGDTFLYRSSPGIITTKSGSGLSYLQALDSTAACSTVLGATATYGIIGTISNSVLFLATNNTTACTIDTLQNFGHSKAIADQSQIGYAAVNAATYTIPDGVSTQRVSGTVASLTIKLPAAPINGQIVRLAFNATIAALTISANTGQALAAGSPTTTAAGATVSYIYDAGGSTWYIIGKNA